MKPIKPSQIADVYFSGKKSQPNVFQKDIDKDELLRKIRGEKEPMTETEILALAASLEVNLDVAEDHITADPPDKVTPELRRAIEANEGLIKALLFKRVLKYARDRGLVIEYSDASYAALDGAWEGTLGDFREALREWARSGLRRAS